MMAPSPLVETLLATRTALYEIMKLMERKTTLNGDMRWFDGQHITHQWKTAEDLLKHLPDGINPDAPQPVHNRIVVRPDVETLATLLKSDGEAAWLEIRQSIANQFASRYLKDIANMDEIRKMYEAIKMNLDTMLQQEVGTWKNKWEKTGFQPSPNFEKEVKGYLQGKVRVQVEDMLSTALDAVLKPAVEAVVEEYRVRLEGKVDLLFDSLVRGQIRKRLDTLFSNLSKETSA